MLQKYTNQGHIYNIITKRKQIKYNHNTEKGRYRSYSISSADVPSWSIIPYGEGRAGGDSPALQTAVSLTALPCLGCVAQLVHLGGSSVLSGGKAACEQLHK